MPLYKFRCIACSHVESVMCPFGKKEAVLKNLVCANCGKKVFEQKFTSKLVSSDRIEIPEETIPNGGCTSCSGSSCNSCR